MIGKFKDAFKQKKPNEIPDVIVKTLSNHLPEGFKYVPLNEDILIIQPDNIENLSISIPNLIELLPDDVNVKNSTEFAHFLHNSQEVMELENDRLILNNNEFSFDQIVLHPFNNLNLKNKLVIKPQPFDEPVKFELSSDTENFHYNILLKRLPNRSVYVQKFEVIGIKNMNINFYFNLEDMSMSMNLNYSLDDSATVKDLIANLKILRAFKNNTVKFNDVIISGANPTIEEDIIDLDYSILLWEKVSVIESAFNVTFNPKSNIDNDDYYWITKLYSSVHDKIGTKQYMRISEFVLTTNSLMQDKDLMNLKEPNTLLSFNQIIKLNLLEANLIIHVVTAWYDYIITDITLDKNEVELSSYKYIIHLESESNKGLIEFTTYFSNEEEADKYIKNGSKITVDYSKAKFINELL